MNHQIFFLVVWFIGISDNANAVWTWYHGVVVGCLVRGEGLWGMVFGGVISICRCNGQVQCGKVSCFFFFLYHYPLVCTTKEPNNYRNTGEVRGVVIGSSKKIIILLPLSILLLLLLIHHPHHDNQRYDVNDDDDDCDGYHREDHFPTSLYLEYFL